MHRVKIFVESEASSCRVRIFIEAKKIFTKRLSNNSVFVLSDECFFVSFDLGKMLLVILNEENIVGCKFFKGEVAGWAGINTIDDSAFDVSFPKDILQIVKAAKWFYFLIALALDGDWIANQIVNNLFTEYFLLYHYSHSRLFEQPGSSALALQLRNQSFNILEISNFFYQNVVVGCAVVIQLQ